MNVKIFKRGNFQQLRILFPSMLISTLKNPEYGRYVFETTFDYYGRDRGSTLFLLNHEAGVNVETPKGLRSFLEQIDYMPASKLNRLEALPQAKERKVENMYKNAVSLKIANKVVVGGDVEDISIIAFMASSFDKKLVILEQRGYDKILTGILRSMEDFFDKENRQMSPGKISALSKIFSTFDKRSFCSQFELTDDSQADAMLLATYFAYQGVDL